MRTPTHTMRTFELTSRLGRALPIFIATVLLCGCPERQPPPTALSSATQSSEQKESAVTDSTDAQDALKASASLGGIPAKYVAHFEAGQLTRITETRESAAAGAANGEYVFYGARLTQYRGAALNSNSNIELNFDMQGGLTSSNTSAGTNSSDEEARAIRNRAQLLRSVALARRSTVEHAR